MGAYEMQHTPDTSDCGPSDVLNVPSVDYPTIQSAIDDAANGDTVQVAAGTYYENLTIECKSILLIGAGAGVTTVNGGGAGSCLVMTNVPDTARVEGFTFTGGSGVSNPLYVSGGGLYLDSSSPAIANNIITGNTADAGEVVNRSGRGGGFYMEDSSPTLTNNVITNNTVTADVFNGGGGLFLKNSSPTLLNNTVSGNTGGQGGGLLLADSSPTLTNNTIADNTAVTLGGGLVLYSSSPTLTGNTITGNSAGGNGGAIMAYPPSSPTLVNNIITGNSAGTGAGGGLRVGENATLIGNTITGNSAGSSGGGLTISASIGGGSVTLTDNVITDNSSGSAGGGVYCIDGYVGTMTNNIITGNSAVGGAGGVHFASCSPTLTGNTIARNTGGSGGGLYIGNSSPTLTNNTITDNVATGQGDQFGGGIYLVSSSSPVLTNNTIAYNTGGGLQNYESPGNPAGTPIVTNCILWGNSEYDISGAASAVTYSDVGIGFSGGTGNISADPIFMDSTGGDYHLWGSSLCIDTGDNLAPALPATDKDGDPRIHNGVVDMGAYESTAVEVAIDVKPGSYPNAINLGAYGLVPVAILSSEDFDATAVDPDTVELAGSNVAVRGKSNKFMAHEEEVNGDSLTDLVVQVATENLDPNSLQDGYAILSGSTYDGQAITGEDEIIIVPTE
jgi:parallel beta-helix repeat protein